MAQADQKPVFPRGVELESHPFVMARQCGGTRVTGYVHSVHKPRTVSTGRVMHALHLIRMTQFLEVSTRISKKVSKNIRNRLQAFA